MIVILQSMGAFLKPLLLRKSRWQQNRADIAGARSSGRSIVYGVRNELWGCVVVLSRLTAQRKGSKHNAAEVFLEVEKLFLIEECCSRGETDVVEREASVCIR